MKPTEKFYETIEESGNLTTDSEIGKVSAEQAGSITGDRFMILGQIKALFDWTLGRSELTS